MAGVAATLPTGSRITDFITLAVLAKTFPIERVRQALAETGKTSIRERGVPAQVVVHYVIILALFMIRTERRYFAVIWKACSG